MGKVVARSSLRRFLHIRIPIGRYAVPLWVLWLALALAVGPALSVILVRPLLSVLAVWGANVAALGWGFAVLLSAAFVAQVAWPEGANLAAPSTETPEPRTSTPTPGGLQRRFVAPTLLLSALSWGGQFSLNVAASRLDSHWRSRMPAVDSFYANHDLAHLVGQSIRMTILRVATAQPDRIRKITLELVAERAPNAWLKLATQSPQNRRQLVVALTEPNLAEFIRDPRAAAGSADAWRPLLNQWAKDAGARAWSDDPSDPLAGSVSRALAVEFGVALREALKHDFATGGKAYAAMQLDLAGELLRSAKQTASVCRSVPEVRGAFSELAERQQALQPLIDEVRADSSAATRRILSGINDLLQRMEELAAQLRAIDAKLDQISRKLDTALAGGRGGGSFADLEEAFDAAERDGNALARAQVAMARVVLAGPPYDLTVVQKRLQELEEERTAGRFQSKSDSAWSHLLWSFKESLSGEVRQAIDRLRAAVRADPDDGRLRNRLGVLLVEHAGGADELREAVQVLQEGLRVISPKDLVQTSLLANLSIACEQLDELPQALAYAEQALQSCRRLYPANVPMQGDVLIRYGCVLHALDRDVEAEQPLRDGMAILRRWHAPDHPNIVGASSSLSAALAALGQWEEAEALAREVLAASRRAHADDHPLVSNSLYNLARLLKDMGRLPEAESLHREELDLCRRLHPADHVDVAASLAALADVVGRLGRNPEAEALYRESLAMRRRVTPGDDPALAGGLSDFGRFLESTGRLGEAESLHDQALQIRRSRFGPEAPAVAWSLGDLANVYEKQNRLEDAERASSQAFGILRRTFPLEHPDCISALRHWAHLRGLRGNAVGAEAMHRDVLEALRSAYPNDHPEVATALSDLGVNLWEQQRLTEAEPLLQQALEMGRRCFRGDHPEVERTLVQLANLMADMGRPAEGLRFAEEAAAMGRRGLPAGHPRLLILEELVSKLRSRSGS